MTDKVFVIDIARCNGCHNCQIACKDEHCGTDWLPIAAAQPETGQFWGRIEETVHGSVPKVNITYQFTLCEHCDPCPLIEIAPDCVYRRDDGLVIIDPVKAKGRTDLVDACPYGKVFWNEEAKLAQKCTGCAHLLDDGWDVPRCVDACPTEALKFGTREELAQDLQDAQALAEGSHVYYRNIPKRWLAGEVYDEEADEVLIGAKVTIQGADGVVLATLTDDFGDFWFKQIEAQKYQVWVEKEGYLTRVLDADATDKDAHVGAIALYEA